MPDLSPRATHCKLNPIAFGQIEVILTLGGVEKTVFSYFSDELSFIPEAFIGRTASEARAIFHRADVAYLRS